MPLKLSHISDHLTNKYDFTGDLTSQQSPCFNPKHQNVVVSCWKKTKKGQTRLQ